MLSDRFSKVLFLGYLFCVWGVLKQVNLPRELNGNVDGNIMLQDIVRCARHKSVQMAGTYVRDSITLYERVREAGFQPSQQVARFRAFLIHNRAVNLMYDGSAAFKKDTLPEQVDWWMSIEHPHTRADTILCLYMEACAKKKTMAAEEQLLGLFQKIGASTADVLEATALLEQVQRDNAHVATASLIQEGGSAKRAPPGTAQRASEINGENGVEIPPPPGVDLQIDIARPPKKVRYGSVALMPQRDAIAKADVAFRTEPSRAKGEVCLSAWDYFLKEADKQGGRSRLNEQARKIYTARLQTSKGWEDCMDMCHRGDRDAFFKDQKKINPIKKKYECTCRKVV
jgi:hypothetical protein